MQEDLQWFTHPIACAHPLLKRAGFLASGVLQKWLCDCQGWIVQFACLTLFTPDEPASALWELSSSSLNKCPPKELRPPANSHEWASLEVVSQGCQGFQMATIFYMARSQNHLNKRLQDSWCIETELENTERDFNSLSLEVICWTVSPWLCPPDT